MKNFIWNVVNRIISPFFATFISKLKKKKKESRRASNASTLKDHLNRRYPDGTGKPADPRCGALHVWRLINPVCSHGGAHKSLIVAADSGRNKRSNSPMWMIESESADFHSWLKKTATSNKAGGTFMLSRDISPPSTPDKPRLPGREPTDLNPEKSKPLVLVHLQGDQGNSRQCLHGDLVSVRRSQEE